MLSIDGQNKNLIPILFLYFYSSEIQKEILTRRLLSSSTVFSSWENSLNDWAEKQRGIISPTPY